MRHLVVKRTLQPREIAPVRRAKRISLLNVFSREAPHHVHGVVFHIGIVARQAAAKRKCAVGKTHNFLGADMFQAALRHQQVDAPSRGRVPESQIPLLPVLVAVRPAVEVSLYFVVQKAPSILYPIAGSD